MSKLIHNNVLSLINRKVADYSQLVKLRLNLLVVFSAAAGYVMVGGGDLSGLLVLCLGGFLVTGASNALNQILEKDYDKLMPRTAERPLAAGRMAVSEAVLASGVMSVGGILLLATFNPLTALFGALSLISYAFIYTPLKRYSPIAVFVGAFPGAFPPLIGAIAASHAPNGEVTMVAMSIFTIQFLWQFPHFWAIGWLGYDAYKNAGYFLLPSGEKDKKTTWLCLTYALMLVPAGIFPWVLGYIALPAMIVLVLAALVFSFYAFLFVQKQDDKAARNLLFASFFYLPVALIALMA